MCLVPVCVLVFVCLVFGGNFALANRMENSRGSRGVAAASAWLLLPPPTPPLPLLALGLSINISTIERIFISQLSNDAGCLDTHTLQLLLLLLLLLHLSGSPATPPLALVLQLRSRTTTTFSALGNNGNTACRPPTPLQPPPLANRRCNAADASMDHGPWAREQGELSNEGQRRLGAEHRLNLFALAAAAGQEQEQEERLQLSLS